MLTGNVDVIVEKQKELLGVTWYRIAREAVDASRSKVYAWLGSKTLDPKMANGRVEK